jgi:acid stress-induced BolA-like protein IbaG/YrbA
MGGNGLGKSKTEVGSLFGGTYKTKKKLKGAPHSNVPRLSVAESANTLFDVTVIDPKTGNEKTMEISALTATEAKSKIAGKTVEVDGEKKHYKVLSVKSAWAEAANPAQQAAIAIAKKKKKGMKEGETGPKFTGYYKGTDKGKPGKKMVGGD